MVLDLSVFNDGFTTMKMNVVQSFVLKAAVMSLSACAGGSVGTGGMFPQMLGIEGATVIGTGKTIIDHIVSFATGKNCSTARKNTGKHYCEEDEVAIPDKVYCYKTLGDVTCYTEQRPHGESQGHLGRIPDHMGPVR